MTAEWKKSPLERAKPREDFKTLQAKVKDLENKLGSAQSDLRWAAGVTAELRKQVRETRDYQTKYEHLRKHGVLFETDGEFKHLQGEDLDRFLEPLTSRTQLFGFSNVDTLSVAQLRQMFEESAHVNSQYYTFNTTNRYIWQPLPKQK